MATQGKDTVDIEVCNDCLFLLANGEVYDGNGDITVAHRAKMLTVWGTGMEITLGRSDGGDDDAHFGTSPCEGCGSRLHGDRHPACAWVVEDGPADLRDELVDTLGEIRVSNMESAAKDKPGDILAALALRISDYREDTVEAADAMNRWHGRFENVGEFAQTVIGKRLQEALESERYDFIPLPDQLNDHVDWDGYGDELEHFDRIEVLHDADGVHVWDMP